LYIASNYGLIHVPEVIFKNLFGLPAMNGLCIFMIIILVPALYAKSILPGGHIVRLAGRKTGYHPNLKINFNPCFK